VAAFAPDVVSNELTEMPAAPTNIGPGVNARIRTEGHRNLLAAAGGAKLLVQSVAFPLSGEVAVAELERTTLATDGVVLRYGTFYGPGRTRSSRAGCPTRRGCTSRRRRAGRSSCSTPQAESSRSRTSERELGQSGISTSQSAANASASRSSQKARRSA
jgi:hypothetical protein